jgi:hypothetical protein
VGYHQRGSSTHLRDHTPSRVPQRWGTTSCREAAPLPATAGSLTPLNRATRLDPLLARGKCVLSETGSDAELDALYQHAAVFAPYERLCEACCALLAEGATPLPVCVSPPLLPPRVPFPCSPPCALNPLGRCTRPREATRQLLHCGSNTQRRPPKALRLRLECVTVPCSCAR